MKAILTIKNGDKDSKNFCRELEIAPEEYDYLCDVSRKSGEKFLSVYVSQI